MILTSKSNFLAEKNIGCVAAFQLFHRIGVPKIWRASWNICMVILYEENEFLTSKYTINVWTNRFLLPTILQHKVTDPMLVFISNTLYLLSISSFKSSSFSLNSHSALYEKQYALRFNVLWRYGNSKEHIKFFVGHNTKVSINNACCLLKNLFYSLKSFSIGTKN